MRGKVGASKNGTTPKASNKLKTHNNLKFKNRERLITTPLQINLEERLIFQSAEKKENEMIKRLRKIKPKHIITGSGHERTRLSVETAKV